VIFYLLILGVVEEIQYFLVPLVLNSGTGEPGGSTMFLNLYIYKNFFGYHDLAYGSTIAWFLFAATLVITLLLFGTARRWVYYAGER
jgi:multiple sugar transport system permease protein